MSGKQGAERAQKLLQPVLTAVGAAFAVERASPPFSTLQDSLYGSRERALLALLALSRADRQIIDVVVDDERVPLVERAWLAAEIADARLAQRYDSWGYHKDERMAALAVWGGVTARGRRFAGYLLRPDNGGLVGCVSRALIAE